MNELWVLLFLLPLVCFLSSSAATGTGSCPDKCGNVSIPYPFGIGQGCFRHGFEITCSKTEDGTERLYTGNVEIINLSVVPAQARVNGHISFACYDSLGNLNSNHSVQYYTNLVDTPYMFSNTLNEFTAVGCTTLTFITSPYGYAGGYSTACLSLCNVRDTRSLVNGAECAGLGCCQTTIPKGLSYNEVSFSYVNSTQPNLAISNSLQCSYGFLAEKGWYNFNVSDVTTTDLYFRNNNGTVPVMLEWAIGGGINETCQSAKLNQTDYACKSQNSYCFDSTNSAPGYTCNCSAGYQGNPYIQDGCIDIDECKDKEQYGCFGDCTNLPGNFSCSCPAGKHGNGSIQDGCQPIPKSKHSLAAVTVITVVIVLCCLIVIAVLYVVYEFARLTRAKRECFKQNGGLLLQQQISSDESVRFKIYTLKEIKKATNNFHHQNIIGRGGQGEVYLGFLKNGRKVAVKRSNVTDIKNKKDFVREMYILSLINHKHVIKIMGCCLEEAVPILVYEFLSGGTLLQNIQNRRMTMSFRLKVAIDCASALAYLHSDASPQILHRDIKCTNILIEGSVAKLSDFGASILPSNCTTERGLPCSYGYFDPESMETGELTEKSDVYSFAVVILELLSGRKAIYNEEESGNKMSLVQDFKEKGLANIFDDKIKYEVTEEQIQEFARLLMWCLRGKGEERPEMIAVVAFLRRMRDINPNLSQQRDTANAEMGFILDSSDQATDSSLQYPSMEHPAGFENDYQLLIR